MAGTTVIMEQTSAFHGHRQTACAVDFSQGNEQPLASLFMCRTVDIARRCGVKVLKSNKGRARQMNAGAAAATGTAPLLHARYFL